MNQENTKMEGETLKHVKKHWHKGSFYFRDAVEKEYTSKGNLVNYLEVEMYMGDRSIVMNCYNDDIISALTMVVPKEKIKVYFSTESKQYNGKWYTNNTIKHIEVPRLIKIEKMKEEYVGGNGLIFDENHSDF